MITRRSWFVYGTLLAIWVALIGWQTAEHARVRRSIRTALRHRAEDISNTLVLSMRPTRGPGLFASKDRVESWLKELVQQGEVKSIEIFNAAGEPLVYAPEPVELPKGELTGGDYWDEKAQTLTLVNPVTLPTNILLSASDFPTNRPPRFQSDRPPGEPPPSELPPGPPPEHEMSNAPPAAPATNAMASTNSTNGPDGMRRDGRGRPPRLTPEEFKALIEKKGTHGFIMVMSAQALNSAVSSDAWLRAFIGLLATVCVTGFGLAWSSAAKTSELQIRLVRASELNSHLKELNLAAAGLAHETRNPLNIVRGLAQMISKQEDAPPEIRTRSRDIIDETDRITAQLNEFINYSRPREVRRAATNLNAVVSEVVRAVNYDIDEKKVQLQIAAEPLTIEADEQLLRQALFNLVLNAIQAVPPNGAIQIRAGRRNGSGAYVEIADNGHGVALEHRAEIFKPYFTTNAEGTGLGLAVVQQIVMAHGWEIECVPNQPSGAIFRITHIKTLS